VFGTHAVHSPIGMCTFLVSSGTEPASGIEQITGWSGAVFDHD
jgi:hypothetical protein